MKMSSPQILSPYAFYLQAICLLCANISCYYEYFLKESAASVSVQQENAISSYSTYLKQCNWLKPIHDSNNKQVVDYAFTFANTTFVNSGVLNAFWFGISVNFSLKPETFSFQNNNLERALDWIFTHPEEEESDALSDMADTEPNDNAFSNANSHSDSTLSPDRDTSGPRVKDGPGRE